MFTANLCTTFKVSLFLVTAILTSVKLNLTKQTQDKLYINYALQQ